MPGQASENLAEDEWLGVEGVPSSLDQGRMDEVMFAEDFELLR